MREIGRNAADGAGFAFDIEQRDVAFGGGVKLQYPRNAEPGFESVPNIRPEPVPAAHPNVVLRLKRVRFGMQQVTAQFTDVLEQRAVPADDVVPEPAGGEVLADYRGAAGGQNRASGQYPADAVIHREAVVQPV